ncbi:TetR/AcrR family transcriptional regulator [Stackebrandtia nassauensis]|uniref:Transcriptional regulator, TetR family n=1 Tax=Stackebrandtia nassauensis (strain DSM 44728 / CIP 108903 / NRRL B-16338 / NBRC 102104 / LLR-40K-21) TaxID=446470 RepID=D3Q3I2_STANL|nr:TetR/AcrR family transcriptional regulator [Stackebrandtia nassauensis]ADD42023.1 transcriptional regulator, TetR family [Stackebrandtia nassauensis DSM 44728]
MARPRRPLLSRDRITAAALAVVDADGLEALSTRRLATELGVSGPSLYNHVATKDELLDDVVDSVLGEVDTTAMAGLSPSRRDWATALAAWARSYRTALAAHPNIVPALASGPGNRPHALRIADAVFGGLVGAGWPRREATRVGALMRYFVTGSALGSFAGGFPADAAVYESGYPHLDQAHLLAERQQRIDDEAFETGLAALLEGLGARYRRLTDAPHD